MSDGLSKHYRSKFDALYGAQGLPTEEVPLRVDTSRPPINTIAARRDEEATFTGEPCPPIPSLRDRAKSLIRVKTSVHVPDEVYEHRQSICAACPHRHEGKKKEEAYTRCGCCGCPAAFYARLNDDSKGRPGKNRYAGHECPLKRFGIWTAPVLTMTQGSFEGEPNAES